MDNFYRVKIRCEKCNFAGSFYVNDDKINDLREFNLIIQVGDELEILDKKEKTLKSYTFDKTKSNFSYLQKNKI